MRTQFIIRIILFILISSSFTSVSAKKAVRKNKIYPISSGEIIKHKYYSLAYAEEYKGALWVFYHLTPAYINGEAIRKDNFRDDPLISTGSATWNDYKGSGYDKGHLCPAAAMKLNQTAMDETFFMSNMSPQQPNFNRGCWKDLESKVCNWVLELNELYVVSGPIYTNIEKYIGTNEVAVPKAYYKVIWDGNKKMIGFILPNEKCVKPLQEYVVSVDSIESITDINFFSKIPNRIEKVIEAEISTENWSF